MAEEIGNEKTKCNSNQEELAALHWAAGSENVEIVKYQYSVNGNKLILVSSNKYEITLKRNPAIIIR